MTDAPTNFGTCACGAPAICTVFPLSDPTQKTPKCAACLQEPFPGMRVDGCTCDNYVRLRGIHSDVCALTRVKE